MKKLFLIPLLACSFCVMATAGNGVEKFFLGVTSGNTVSASVFDGLNLELQLPADGAVDMSSATVEMRMQDVPALGVTSPRSQVVTVNTGLNGQVSLLSWLDKAYAFNGTQMVVSVKAAGATQSFLFNFAAIENGLIKATPNSEDAAKAAWELIAAQVTAQTKVAEDSYILLKEGSYIQLGGEKLIFKEDHAMLQGNWTMNGFVSGLAEATDIIPVNGAENVIFIAEGSVLAVGNSMATSKANVSINLANNAADPFAGVLSDLRGKMADGNVRESIISIVSLFNKFAGFIDAAEVNYLTINVGEGEGEGELAPEEAEAPQIGVSTVLRAGLTPGFYYTFCLPYGVDSYTGGTFFEINRVIDEDNLELISVNSLAAGVAYVCIPTEEEVKGIYNSNHENAPIANRAMHGTFENIQVPAGMFIFGNDGLHPSKSLSFLAANRAYVDMDEASELVPYAPAQAAGRRRVVVGGHNAPTAIDEVAGENVASKKMIENGQLFIIRDGVKYNAQGAIVK